MSNSTRSRKQLLRLERDSVTPPGHLTTLQVNGLPTNQAFLKRLAVHPAFQAAELDTSFIQKHHASLVDTEAPPPHATALAAVADHLLQVQQVCIDLGTRAEP